MNDDRANGVYRVTLTRYTKYGQWDFFTENPAGGGFGANTSNASLRTSIKNAVSHLKPGTRYRLVVNDEDRGIQTKEE